MERNLIENCTLCPRKCGINRSISNISPENSRLGYCGQTDHVKLARAALHYYEEPCISGNKGSGAVFFSGCNLGCVFCQNQSISHENYGKEISVERLAAIFIELQNKSAHNINLVTPTHFVPLIIEAVKLARSEGFSIPIVYNTSSYETCENIQLLDGYVDIFLPDFKYWDNELASKYSNAKNYRDFAIKSIDMMVAQKPVQKYDDDGIMQEGVIVRHMILPGHTKDSMRIIEYLYKTYGNSISLSLLSQYTPLKHVEKYPELNRKITKREYDKVVDYALSLGVSNAFIQEGDAVGESFIPDFNLEGI